MSNTLTIYLDRLRSGGFQEFNDTIEQDFLQCKDDIISFCSNVTVKGKAYLADDFLILHLSVSVDYLIPCKICNEEQNQTLTIQDFYYSVCTDTIKNAQFCPLEVIRETILSDTPNIFECNEGNCEKRANLKQYLKNGEDHGST